ncbi:hypothetical protein C8Q72DRAFT_794082 [Fomitopsis betulina]|nr:hypothetical protein C8Q72DRAFT_794082 [Fomitopsis betulina]
MADMEVVELQDLTEQQLDVFEAIFVTNMSDSDRSLMGPMIWVMVHAATLGGEIYTASKLNHPKQQQLGWDDWFAKYPKEVSMFMNRIFGAKGKLDSWYLNVIMVHPEHQGQGIATQFINIVHEKASYIGI